MAAQFRMEKKGYGKLLRSPTAEVETLRRAKVIEWVAISLGPSVTRPGTLCESACHIA
ncbi:hypothetical protein [Streptomyces sp. NPDC003077]|uniref:hypothetical protein n=1 Tax=Streptomyces sp. NPDC003077 TaxID=3154443 RepID=UPI00339F1E79